MALAGRLALASLVLLLGCEKGTSPPEATPAPSPPEEPRADEAFDAVPSAAPGAEGSPTPPPTSAVGAESAREAAVSLPELNELAKKLDDFARENRGRARLAVYDLARSAWVTEWSADEVENPASTQKILTAAAALELLGPAFTFDTEVFGRVEDEGRVLRLVLRGGGAPDLTTADLWRLARIVVESGAKSVGEIVVDASRFDEHFVPPAFEQQPDEWAAFRAPVSALAVDRNTVALHVLPTTDGAPAKFWYEPPGLVVSNGAIATRGADAGDRVTWSLSPRKESPGLVSEVGGALASGLGRRKYSRRLDDPRLAPGLAFAELLREAGVETGAVKSSMSRVAVNERLARLESAPLAEIVRALGKESDNFTAEMLLIALSRFEGTDAKKGERPWSTARGVVVLEKWLRDRNLFAEGVRLRNGSGLFDANRLSPRLLARVLRLMLERPGVYAEFLGQLALGGQDGTLRNRFDQGALAGRVRAKTGTLRDVSALAGYVLRNEGRPPVVFAIVVSGAAGRQDETRRRIDRTLGALVEKLGL